MTHLLECKTEGLCDHRTKKGLCYAHLTDTDFGNKMCPFKHIDGLMPHKYAAKMLDEGKTFAEVMEITGYTETQFRKVINEWRRMHEVD